MPSTVYKGDLTEISFGHESGLLLTHGSMAVQGTSNDYNNDPTIDTTDTAIAGAAASDVRLVLSVGCSVSGTGIPTGAIIGSFTDGDTYELAGSDGSALSTTGGSQTNQTLTYGFAFKHQSTDAVANTSVIRLGSPSGAFPVSMGILQTPRGMLVGTKLSIIGVTNFTADDSESTGQIYTVVAHQASATETDFTITPALSTATSTFSSTSDALNFHPFKLPSLDVNMLYADDAHDTSESSLTDQFLGVTTAVTLPETRVDLKRYHVIGLGRDVSVQVPGRFINEGGSFEVNMHNPRWLYYCLGMEAVDIGSTYDTLCANNDYALNGAVAAGASVITWDSAGASTPTFSSGSSAVAAGDYVIIKDTTTESIVSFKEGDQTAFGSVSNPQSTYFDTTEKGEIRRIVAITTTQIFLDDPLCFSHADNTVIRFARFHASTTQDIPVLASTGIVTNGVTRLLYSRSHVPSFAMEVSIRRRDNQADDEVPPFSSNIDTEVVDGGASDAKQLTRVFRGCKVKEFSLTADTDAALRLSVGFDSALCYTDTGRLEGSSPGDRYNPHRIFEDTANTDLTRKEAGIAVGTQKPYMFYNGTITVAGVQIGQVVSFTVTGTTGVQQFYTINGAPIADAATDQVPFAGARNASIAVEGQTEYMADLEIIVDDPIFYHKMRRAVDHDATTANMIRLSFTKAGSAGTRESIDIYLDDYVITEAPLPIPEDKGPIRAPLKVMPKAIRVISTDTLFHC